MSASSCQPSCRRLRDLCAHVEELIKLVPTVLPIIGRPPASPSMTDYERRLIVDKSISRIAIPWEEWDRLFQSFPECSCQLKLLARSIDDLRDRFEDEDREHQMEIDTQAQAAEDQRARGVKMVRERYTMPPERRIHLEELECVRSYLSLVTEAANSEVSEHSEVDEEGTTAAPWPEGKDTPTAATKRKRLKPGTAALKIRAALDALAAKGQWNVSEKEIYNLARVSRSTYYNVCGKDDAVKRAIVDYHACRLGRGPARADDI